MKRLKSWFLLLTVFFSFGVFTFVKAEEEVVSPAAYIENLKIDKNQYVAGETVRGSFTIINGNESSMSDLYYTVVLAGEYGTDGIPQINYDKSTSPSNIFLKSEEEKTISFSYKLPDFVDGEKLGIEIQAFTKAGIPLGWSDAFMSLKASVKPLTVIGSAVTVKGIDFTPKQGPTIKKDDNAKFLFAVKNTNSETVSVKPIISIYDRTTSGAQIAVIQGSSTDILKGQTKSFEEAVVTKDLKPGVYVAVIELKDADGKSRAPALEFQYIIGGDMVTIHSVSSDKILAKKGEVVTVSVQYTGMAQDLVTGTSPDVTNAKLEIKLFNEKNQIVGTYEEVGTYSIEGNKKASITLTAKARALRAETTISKDGNILAQNTTLLNQDFDIIKEQIDPDLIAYSFAVIIVLVILALALVFKKRKNTIITAVVLSIVLGGSVYFTNQAEGYVETSRSTPFGPPTISISSPYQRTSKHPVASGVAFTLTGSIAQSACNNKPAYKTITASFNSKSYTKSFFRDTDSSVVGHHELSRSVTYTDNFALGPFTTMVNKGQVVATNPITNIVSLYEQRISVSGSYYQYIYNGSVLTNQKAGGATAGYHPFYVRSSGIKCVGDVAKCADGVSCPPCVIDPDVCTNLPDNQSIIPFGYHASTTASRICDVDTTVDLCTNLPGNQATMPSDYEAGDTAGICDYIGTTVGTTTGTSTPPITNLCPDRSSLPADGICRCSSGAIMPANGNCINTCALGLIRCSDGICRSNCSCAVGETRCSDGICKQSCDTGAPIITKFTAEPSFVSRGNTCHLVWTVSNSPTSCTLNGYGITNNLSVSPSGSTDTTPISSRKTYTLSCSKGVAPDPVVNVTKSVDCNINPNEVEN